MYNGKRQYRNGRNTYRLRRRRPFLRNAGIYRRRFDVGDRKELKFLNDNIALITISTTGVNLIGGGETTILHVAQGNGPSQRIGRKITIKQFLLRLTFEMASQISVALAHDTCRILVYWDTQANGITSDAQEILDTTSGAATYNSFRDLRKGSRFKVLHDKYYYFNASMVDAGTNTNVVVRQKNMYFKMHVPVYYDGATVDVSELTQNNLMVVAISKHGRITVSGRYRVRYTG